VSIFDFVDSVSVLQLETTEKCLLATISKIIPYSNRYYLFDGRQDKVFCFDNNGKFLFQISQKGRGPTEYSYLEDIAVDQYNNQLILLVPFGELLFFDLDGNFIYKEFFPNIGGINEVFVIDADMLLFTSLNEYYLLFYSRTQKKVIDKMYPKEDVPSLFSAHNRLYAFNDSIYFSSIFGNEILNMSKSDHPVVFTWNFGKMNNSAKQIDRMITHLKEQRYIGSVGYDEFVGEKSFFNYYIILCKETSKYRIAMLEYAGDFLLIYFEKETEKSYVFEKTIEGIRPFPFFIQDESMFVYDYGETPRDFTPFTTDVFSPQQLKIIQNHDSDSENPFLVIYHLKK
jgi:hypothetical protein